MIFSKIFYYGRKLLALWVWKCFVFPYHTCPGNMPKLPLSSPLAEETGIKPSLGCHYLRWIIPNHFLPLFCVSTEWFRYLGKNWLAQLELWVFSLIREQSDLGWMYVSYHPCHRCMTQAGPMRCKSRTATGAHRKRTSLPLDSLSWYDMNLELLVAILPLDHLLGRTFPSWERRQNKGAEIEKASDVKIWELYLCFLPIERSAI